jgi:hypothetical protein
MPETMSATETSNRFGSVIEKESCVCGWFIITRMGHPYFKPNPH